MAGVAVPDLQEEDDISGAADEICPAYTAIAVLRYLDPLLHRLGQYSSPEILFNNMSLQYDNRGELQAVEPGSVSIVTALMMRRETGKAQCPTTPKICRNNNPTGFEQLVGSLLPRITHGDKIQLQCATVNHQVTTILTPDRVRKLLNTRGKWGDGWKLGIMHTFQLPHSVTVATISCKYFVDPRSIALTLCKQKDVPHDLISCILAYWDAGPWHEENLRAHDDDNHVPVLQ